MGDVFLKVMPSFIHHLRKTSPKARRIFGTCVVVNTSCVVWVHFDQKAQMARMHAGVALDEQRLEKKLKDKGVDPRALYQDLPEYSRREVWPEHALAKNHQPVPPENIPELAALGVTRESTFVPGMHRPEVDVN